MREDHSPDKGGHVLLVVGGVDELLKGVELGWVDLSVPLQLVLPLLDHRPQVLVLVHPLQRRTVKWPMFGNGP
jgi:hypothetical protein